MGFLTCFCCKPRKVKKERRVKRRHQHAAALAQHVALEAGGKYVPGDDSASEYLSCRDDFSSVDGDHLSPRHSIHMGAAGWGVSVDKGQDGTAGGAVTPGRSKLGMPAGHNQPQSPSTPNASLHPDVSAVGAVPAHGPAPEFLDADVAGASESDMSESGTAAGGAQNDKSVMQVLKGCLPILENLSLGSSPPAGPGHPHNGAVPGSPVRPPHHPRSRRRSGPEAGKPEAGCSLQPRDMAGSALDVSWCYEDGANTPVLVRSQDYMRTKVKVASAPPLYTLASADIFATQGKQEHVARLLQLPHASPPTQTADGFTLPPILIFNLQLPLYQPSLFGPYDGPGVSIVFCFRVAEGLDVNSPALAKVLGLFSRLIANGREADGAHTRERLKLIPRVVNVEQWAAEGPLSQPEYKLLCSYNEKPILTRPQHKFHAGRTYFEIDLDLHQYTYLARKAVTSYLQRLKRVVWENAFVIQGNSADELPEHLLGCARIYRCDFQQAKPLSVYQAAVALPPAMPAAGQADAGGRTPGKAAGQADEMQGQGQEGAQHQDQGRAAAPEQAHDLPPLPSAQPQQ